MYYEPVGYIVEYEISALIFLAVIMARFFRARRFPNQKNRLFAVILVYIFIDMILDVVSSWFIDYVFVIPVALTYTVNGIFYIMQIGMPLLMTLYVLVLVGPLNRQRVRKLFLLFVPGIAVVVLMLLNPLTHWFFYVDPQYGYVHAEYFISTYILCFFYMGVTLFVTLRNRAVLRRSEFESICLFLAVVLVSILIQYLVPALLITGVAMALAVILMYFTIQNPETMLDTITGAFTYEAMLTFLQDRMQENDRVQLVAVEVCNMHRINELLGVENGSLLLLQISQFLRTRSCHPWVFRMRGGCFVAITRKDEDYAAMRLQIEERIGLPWTVGNTDILVQATVCCAAAGDLLNGSISPREAMDWLEEGLLRKDETGGRIQTVTVGHEMLRRINRAQAVEAALREAIETGEGFELHFQPLWSIREERFVSAEVLLRFHSPVLGDISPAEFVPIAEGSGFVSMLDELVLRKTCAFIRDHDPQRTLGLHAIEINLSAMEFMNNRLPELVASIVAEYRIDPGFLVLEITETAATESFELLKETMATLCAQGCRFALDDFGMGYANISRVIRLPFSMVKLDRTLLLGPRVVLEDMAHMFTRMDLLTVVEGVETPAQSALAKDICIDLIQGYYYARPMRGDDFVAFMERKSESYGPKRGVAESIKSIHTRTPVIFTADNAGALDAALRPQAGSCG